MAWHLGFITDEGQQMTVVYNYYKPDQVTFYWDKLDKSMCLKIDDVRTHIPAADWSSFLDFIEAANAELIRKTQPPLPAPTDELAIKIASKTESIDLDALTTALRYIDSMRKDPPTAAQLAELNGSVAS